MICLVGVPLPLSLIFRKGKWGLGSCLSPIFQEHPAHWARAISIVRPNPQPVKTCEHGSPPKTCLLNLEELCGLSFLLLPAALDGEQLSPSLLDLGQMVNMPESLCC
jgi:hypothetical protein